MLKRYLMLALILSIVLTVSFPAFAQTKQKTQRITPAQRPLDLGPPKVLLFKINDGVKTTTSTTVTLNNITERATLFCASERPDLKGAYWKNIRSDPRFILSTGNGTKTVYFQVADPQGRKSPIVNDTINLSMAPTATKSTLTKQLYTIKGGDFYHEAQNYGFNTNAHSLSFGSNCRKSYRRDSYNECNLSAEARNQIVGSKCDFTVFDPAKLKNGFVFKSFTGHVSKSSKADIQVKSSPSSGSTSIKFILHGWAEPGKYAIYHIDNITLEGPSGRDWRDALH